jgi:transcriptional regulator with XRE-family HTH domain
MKSHELKKWRLRNNYSQTDLARALGVSNITISRWERQEREIPPFLHLALKCLKKKGGEILKGRPPVRGRGTRSERQTKKGKEV